MPDHPFTAEDLVRYAVGDLDDDRSGAVEQHLGRSTEARKMVIRVRRVLDTMAADDAIHPPDHVVAQVLASFTARRKREAHRLLEETTRFIARLVFDQRRQPTLAGFRGGGGGAQLAYECEHARVDLRLIPPGGPLGGSPGGPPEALPVEGSSADWRVKGQVTFRDGESSAGLVALLDPDHPDAASETRLDERGRFQLASPPGSFDLLIELEEGVLMASGLQVG